MEMNSDITEYFPVTEEELKQICACLQNGGMYYKKHFPKNCYLGRQGEPADYLFFILSGKIKVVVSGLNGQEKILSLINPFIMIGESGFFSQGTYNASMCAITAVECIQISHSALQYLMDHIPGFSTKLLYSMGRKIYVLTKEVSNLSFYDIRTRLIEKLLLLAQEYGTVDKNGTVCITSGVTDRELADMVGTSREVIARHMGSLRSQGIIKRQKRNLLLTDITILRKSIDLLA